MLDNSDAGSVAAARLLDASFAAADVSRSR
jgi:hypothetical protein